MTRITGHTTSDLSRALGLLESGGHTCVLCRGSETLTGDAHGVAPLVDWLSEGVDLAGFSAADRVVGRAAALLYVAAGVTAVHALVASEPGLAVLAAHGVEGHASTVVGAILDRTRTASCPMEAAVAGIDDPQQAVRILRAAVDSLRKVPS